MYWDNLVHLANIPVALILIGIPATIFNSTCEELLWRGLYARGFPNRRFLGWSYPALGFAVWHLSPELVIPSGGGQIELVVQAFFLGLAYGWVAYRTGSVRWTALSHSLNGSILTVLSG